MKVLRAPESAEEVEKVVSKTNRPALDIFTKLLSLWILLCIILGTVTGVYAPHFASFLANAQVASVNIPIAILVWLMVFPMMLKVDFTAILQVRNFVVPIGVTTTANYCIQPFAMYGFARLFFNEVFGSALDTQTQEAFVGGAVLLGAGPCTAMVFVWSYLVDGDATYTLVQVALNDILLLFLFAPTVGALLEIGTIEVPWLTIVMSTVLFILVPLLLAVATRYVAKRGGYRHFVNSDKVERVLALVSRLSLVLTVFSVFVMQGQRMVDSTDEVLMILVPLTIQTITIFALVISVMYFLRVEFRFAAPGALISTSNFFELSVAVAITTFGPESGAAIVTVCGVLEEVPLMLFLVWICIKLKPAFLKRAKSNRKQGVSRVPETVNGAGLGGQQEQREQREGEKSSQSLEKL